MFSTLEDLLLTQSVAIGIVLLISGTLLARRGLFCWTTAGFWTWVAFALYFFFNPLTSIRWNVEHYRIYLLLSGGLSRGEWIGFVAIVGIIVFFFSYLRASTRPITWNLRLSDFRFTLAMKAVMIGFLGIASLSLLTYRTGALSASRSLEIEGGRFTGETTGYEYTAHFFFFVPVVSLLLSQSRFHQLLGLLMSCGYVVLSMPDAWARFTIVSMLLAISLAATIRRARSWPRPVYIIAIFLITAVLLLRGHTGLSSGEEFYEFVTRIPNEIGSILAAGDSAMLASWYLESYVKDHITGYDYGLPFINYVFFGFIPSRLFPQKYFLVDWLRARQPAVLDPIILAHLYGAKSSLLGSFYANGGVIAVVLLMGMMGRLCRRMDGMLSQESPLLVKATAIGWMSALWMIWGSHDFWGFTLTGSLVIPAIFLWLVAPKKHKQPVQAISPEAKATYSSFHHSMR
jgi:hypothetical protein